MTPHKSPYPILLKVALVLVTVASPEVAAGHSNSAWQLNSDQIEREQVLASPAHVGRAALVYNARFQAGRDYSPESGAQIGRRYLFECVEPSEPLFNRFVINYNRSFHQGSGSSSSGSSNDRPERKQLFDTTMRRTIMLNKIIQSEILDAANYRQKPKIGNYHFIMPLGETNSPLWYADITDCELGLIKKDLFNIFDFIDSNQLHIAYQLVKEKSSYLPLFDEEAFEQLANILLVRLYDRFEGDKKMNQLFQWPLYMKKLAAYAYNRQQVTQPNFEAKLALITFAYPAYFKDLKYNLPAVNRTNDNERAHEKHEKFNANLNRKISNIRERNRRLAIFRQHWSMINLLNDDREWNSTKLDPDWIRAQQYQPNLQSAKLLQDPDSDLSTSSSFAPTPKDSQFKQTSFIDLTDAEFVAYLTNDFSMLEHNQESAKFLDANFPIRPLTPEFKDEIAAELEQRKLLQLPKLQQQLRQQQPVDVLQKRPTWNLARQVVDELIGDVGLPIGPASVDNIPEQEQYRKFNEIKSLFNKNYQPQTLGANRGSLSETDLRDEQQRRYEIFKTNYGRFRAYALKDQFRMTDSQETLSMRLADMSWHDIKLTLFKICCLAKPSLDDLSATNSSIRYLASNDFLCQPLRNREDDLSFNTVINNNAQQRQTQLDSQSYRVAMELYYYYCVHFNKHHSDEATFKRRFAIFRHNIDQIRWHSCTRGLTLLRSLMMKSFDTLNTIDVLDARRSYTDDINLDRFRYFSIPDLAADSSQDESNLGFDRLRDRESDFTSISANGRVDSSRAGISYRREPIFMDVMQNIERQPQYPRDKPDSYYNYAERRLNYDLDLNKSAQKYRSLAVQRVYDIVTHLYRECMSFTYPGIDLTPRTCDSGGLFRDQAADGTYILNRNQGSLYSPSQRLQREKDACSMYWHGLTSWSEGLIKQDFESARLIQEARC